MGVQLEVKQDCRIAVIRPFTKGQGRIAMSQTRMRDPHMFGGQDDWGKFIIEWVGEMTPTADDADKMIAALEEVACIYREWEQHE
jgi:hypothetical protein